ncbi:SigE family RNA polymerase sigma factor [Flindersiella endophytica]
MSDALEEFTAFAAARQQALGRMAFLLTGEHHAAEDLVQIALAKAYLAWDRIRAKDATEAYVRRIIVNEYTSWWRRTWRRREQVTDELPERPACDDDYGERDEIWQAIRRLSPKQRAVIVLRYYEDLTEVETANVLDVTVGTVKSQTSRAFTRLRADLSANRTETPVTKEEFTP